MAEVKMKVQPWATPNYVRLVAPPSTRQEGLKEAPALHVKDVDAEVLSQLCDDFRATVFKEAGKEDPQWLVMTAEPPKHKHFWMPAATSVGDSSDWEYCGCGERRRSHE